VHPTETDPAEDAHMRTWLALLDAHMLTFAWTGR
jgi:hypothetical protein